MYALILVRHQRYYVGSSYPFTASMKLHSRGNTIPEHNTYIKSKCQISSNKLRSTLEPNSNFCFEADTITYGSRFFTATSAALTQRNKTLHMILTHRSLREKWSLKPDECYLQEKLTPGCFQRVLQAKAELLLLLWIFHNKSIRRKEASSFITLKNKEGSLFERVCFNLHRTSTDQVF